MGGATRNLFAIYIIVEGVKGGTAKHPEQHERVADLMSGLYQVGDGATMIASPIIGSALYEAVGFEWAMDLEAAVFLVNSLVYTLYTLSDLQKEKQLKSLPEASQ